MNAVVTLIVGEQGREMGAISLPSLRSYAQRIGAKFHFISVDKSSYAIGEKFRVRKCVEHYDRLIYLDADVLLSPDCPSLFDVVPKGSIGAHDDLRPYGKLNELSEWVQKETDAICDSQDMPRRTVDYAYNSGVLVLDREHAGFFDPPKKPIPKYHCSEQWYEWLNVKTYGYPVFHLPSAYNYQWWFEKKLPLPEHRPDIKVWHFAGMNKTVNSSHEERIRLMREYAEKLKPL